MNCLLKKKLGLFADLKPHLLFGTQCSWSCV